MATTNLDLLSELVRQAVYLLDERTPNLDFLLSAIGTHPYVLLGEASHGTHEFYRVRAEITKRLIREKGFRTIAIEADWPDTARINRYIQGIGEDKEAIDALSDFQRFPSWMWRNADFLDFVGWLRHYNDPLPPEDKVEIFGLDLYSLHASMAAVIDYLEKVDRVQAQRARARYACFDMFGGDSQAYGYAAGLGLSHTCETEVLTQLVELQERAAHSFTLRDSREVFSAEQNAFVVKNAEEYYRTMFFGDVSSWNLRDSHMAETFERILAYRQTFFPSPKAVLWAHNSHVGDARATQMGRSGEHNIGQLLRTTHPGSCFHVGFTTYEGTVTAADAWDSAPRSMKIRRARPESYEHLFHLVEVPAFILALKGNTLMQNALHGPLLERAIGVIYRPDSELQSHCFSANLPQQFDAIVHLDRTRAVEPLEDKAIPMHTEPDETFPSGF